MASQGEIRKDNGKLVYWTHSPWNASHTEARALKVSIKVQNLLYFKRSFRKRHLYN